MFELSIKYNPTTGECQVSGIPILEMPDGSQKVHKGLCYAALGIAKDMIRELKPGEKKPSIFLANRIPGLNGGHK